MVQRIGSVAFLTLIFGCLSALAFAQDVPLSDCDTYAADDQDVNRKSKGMIIDKIDGTKAIFACLEALSRYPDVPRFQYQLGRAYDKNDDMASATTWYRKAAEQGYAPAQSFLGEWYYNGSGVTKDVAQAIVWWRKAAEQGDVHAQINLGSMFANGAGVAKDDEQAVAWYRKAAQQGYATAQRFLGYMYYNGRGVSKNEGQAAFWYRKAADQGDETAKSNLTKLAREQLLRAEGLLRQVFHDMIAIQTCYEHSMRIVKRREFLEYQARVQEIQAVIEGQFLDIDPYLVLNEVERTYTQNWPTRDPALWICDMARLRVADSYWRLFPDKCPEGVDCSPKFKRCYAEISRVNFCASELEESKKRGF